MCRSCSAAGSPAGPAAPPTDHDVDFFIRPEHADASLEALLRAGMETERPPENWLVKAYDDGMLVDLIFEPSGVAVDDEMFERAEEIEVDAVRMLVASLEDVLTTKLLALSEQNLDYWPVLEIARTVREQIDWDQVRGADGPVPVRAGLLHAGGRAQDRCVQSASTLQRWNASTATRRGTGGECSSSSSSRWSSSPSTSSAS